MSIILNKDDEWETKWSIVEKTEDELAIEDGLLRSAKLHKANLINVWRQEANFSQFTYGGKQIACDQLSRSDIDAVCGHVSLFGTFPANFPGGWKTMDNSYVVLGSVDAFKTMYQAMTTQGTMNFARSQALKAALQAATTIEQVEAITW